MPMRLQKKKRQSETEKKRGRDESKDSERVNKNSETIENGKNEREMQINDIMRR